MPSLSRCVSWLQIITVVTAGLISQQPELVRVRVVDQRIPLHDRAGAPMVLRIVDGMTGEPIAGADAFTIAELEYPLPAVFESRAAAQSDADGFVELPPPNSGWVMVRAAGRGPAMNGDPSDRIVPLAPGIDVPVRCEDWRGVPLAGYLCGFCGGCGHTPDLGNTITDAQGIALLRSVDPGNGIADLYLENAPIDFDYDCIRWQPGDPPVVHRFAPGLVCHGVVLQADGGPAAHAIVGSPIKHRGPWTATDANGRFVLGGIPRGETFFVVSSGRHVEFRVPEQSPCTLRLPPPGPDDYVPGDPPPQGPRGILRCTAHLAAAAAAPADLTIDARGPLPGSWAAAVLPTGDFELVAGSYVVRAASSATHAEVRTVTVTAGTVTEVAFELQALPTATIAVEGLPRGGSVSLCTADGNRDVTAEVVGHQPIPVDPAREYCVRLDTEGERRSFPCQGFALLAGAGQPFRWFAPTRITASLVDGHGERVAADVALLEKLPLRDVDAAELPGFDPQQLQTVASDGDVALTSEDRGRAYLWIRPHGDALAPRMVPLALPERGDHVELALGRVELAPQPVVRLLQANGAPLRGGVAILRTGAADFREHEFEVVALAADGSWIGPDLAPDDVLMVPADDDPQPDAAGVPTVALPFRWRRGDDMPQTLRLPDGRLLLHVVDDDGTPLAHATVLLRDCLWPADGQLAITRLPPGDHRLFVGAEDRKTAIVDVHVDAGERREVRLALPRR